MKNHSSVQRLYEELPSISKLVIKTLVNNHSSYLTSNFREQMLPIIKKLHPKDEEIEVLCQYPLNDVFFNDIAIRICELTYIDWNQVLKIKKEERCRLNFSIFSISIDLAISLLFLFFGKKRMINLVYSLAKLPLINDVSPEGLENHNFLIDLATLKQFGVIK